MRDPRSSGGLPSATAVILAGGRGTRLGRRKESAPFPPAGPDAPPRTLLDLHLDRWGRLFPRVAVSCRTSFDHSLPAGVATILDPPDAESVIDGLAAILDSLANTGGPAFVIAVDCPVVPPSIARTLLAAHTPGTSVFLAAENGPEMLCGLYDPTAREAITAMLADGERKLSRIAERAPARMLRFPDDFPPLEENDPDEALAARLGPFFNVNTPGDLARLTLAVAERGGEASP